MLQMKDSDTWKLKFPESCYTPCEYEKWIQAIRRSMEAYHTEIGLYWGRVTKSAEETYQPYLKDVRVTRVNLRPRETLNRIGIETRFERK